MTGAKINNSRSQSLNGRRSSYTIVPLKLDFVAQKKGGMAVSAVWTLVYLLAPCPAEPKSTPTRTGETPCAPLLKSKSMLLLVLLKVHRHIAELIDVRLFGEFGCDTAASLAYGGG